MAAVRAKGSGSEVTLAGSNLFRGCTGAPISANLLGMVRVKGMVGVEVRMHLGRPSPLPRPGMPAKQATCVVDALHPISNPWHMHACLRIHASRQTLPGMMLSDSYRPKTLRLIIHLHWDALRWCCLGSQRLGEERQNFSAHGGGRWTDQVAVGTQGGKVLFDLE